VFESEYTNAKGRRSVEKVIVAESERTSIPVSINLRDSWFHTSIAAGTIVHVAHLRQNPNQSSTPGQFIISDVEESPLLIVHPDHMLSATTVADSFDCMRKAVLQNRIKATSEAAKPLVYGSILHEVFQQALSANQWDDAFLAELVERTVQGHVEGLWELGMSNTVLAIEEIKAKMAELVLWARIFVAESPSDAAIVDDKQDEKIWMSISKLIAIEEHIWSPLYGLKGNIDATIEATVMDHPKEPRKKFIVPFEVKTGKTTRSPAHRAQTALYTLLLSDRYDVPVKAGILYYLESSAMSRIAPPLNEMRQMVQQRNRLAGYIHRAKFPAGAPQAESVPAPSQSIEESCLPTMLRNPFKCGNCYAQQSCFAYHALVENGSSDTAGMIDDGKKNHSHVWHEAVGHLQLTSKDKPNADTVKRWLKKWDRLLTFEESELSRFRKEVWTMGSSEREAAGRCFGSLVISQDLTSTAANMTSSIVDGIQGSGGKINRYAYVFARFGSTSRASFTEGTQLAVGEPIVVSSESGQWALANGYIVALTKHAITVAVDRRLGAARQRQVDFDAESNQSFKGIMTVGNDTTSVSTSPNAQLLYRIDKDEFSNGLALVRSNLVTIMSSHPIHTKLRNHIIFNAEPSFAANSTVQACPPSQLGAMNEDQIAAVRKVLAAQDYALILGMPGTGKTTTIAHVIRALLAEDKTILLTSYTHTAVDNILLKIREVAPPNSILRLGVPAKINAQVQEFCQLAATPRKTIDEIETAYTGCQIVATTCMGTNHPLFNRRAFDVCIVDEASQITLPTSLGPLLHARKFVLVGDHYQLPPLVQNKAALEGGLDVSLFRQLSEAHPDAVATLGKQYRMCEDIMSLSNALIYSGQLRCGSDAVARRTLQSVDMSALSAFHNAEHLCSTPSRGGKCWLADFCRPERKVVYANTDLAGKRATETLNLGKNITNDYEATLTAQLVLSFLGIGVPAREIGVITLYRSQLALMRRLFKVAGVSSEVEIDSADRFQGRDKECVVLSMVRSNDSGIVGDLLKDWRRVNVALTRARSKLIVLGSRQTLQNNELLAKFLGLVDDNGWSVDLPKDADDCHTFNFSSQVTSEILSMSAPTPAKKAVKASPTKQTPMGSQARKVPGASPSRKTPIASPRKATSTPRSRTLRESPSAANRSVSGARRPGKVINGRASQSKKKALEEAAVFIFEDLTADEL
jgi:DNA replication ATP-dependent helicase Dna2